MMTDLFWDEVLLTNNPDSKELEVSFKKIDGDGFLTSAGDEPGTPGGIAEDPNGDDNGVDDDGDGVDDRVDDGGGDGGPVPPTDTPPECLGQDCAAWENALVDNTVNTSGLVTLRDATDPTFTSNIVDEFSLWLGTGGTMPDQTSIGWRALNVDGSQSDMVSIIGSKPNQSFGSSYQPVQEVIGLNNPCVTNPNIWQAEGYRLAPGRYFGTIQGAGDSAMNTLTVGLSQNYSTGREGWPFLGKSDYSTTQITSDFVFLTGSTVGATVSYAMQAQFSYTSCDVPIPPTNGDTGPYNIHVATCGSSIRFRQTTAGSTGKVAIERFNGVDYSLVTGPDFMSMGDYLHIQSTLITNVSWDTSQITAPDNFLRAEWSLLTAIENLTTGARATIYDNDVEVTGEVNARSYCIPMHPSCVLESGILYSYALPGNLASMWRVGYAGNKESGDLIVRSISNYTPPDYCSRIP